MSKAKKQVQIREFTAQEISEFFDAIYGGVTAEVENWLSRGMDPNIVCIDGQHAGKSAMLIMSTNWRPSILKLLLEYGAKVDSEVKAPPTLIGIRWMITFMVHYLIAQLEECSMMQNNSLR